MAERFQIKKPDIPIGVAGIAKTVELVNQALLDTILPLQQRQERLLKASQIHPATLPEMVRMDGGR